MLAKITLFKKLSFIKLKNTYYILQGIKHLQTIEHQ
jgi:hypothetical protein